MPGDLTFHTTVKYADGTERLIHLSTAGGSTSIARWVRETDPRADEIVAVVSHLCPDGR